MTRYEIVRDSEANWASVRFDGRVPVEVREAMISNDITFYSYGHDWRAVGKTDDEIREIIEDGFRNVKDRHAVTKAEEKALEEEYMARIMEGETEKWRKYYKDRIGVLVRLSNDLIVNIEKSHIETRFCFGESGYDFDDAVEMAETARTSFWYFKNSNLRALKEMVQLLARDKVDRYIRDDQYLVRVRDGYKKGIGVITLGMPAERYGLVSEMGFASEEDRERLLEGYEKAYAAFEKRLDAYLKRYGLSKVHSWTYWRDA